MMAVKQSLHLYLEVRNCLRERTPMWVGFVSSTSDLAVVLFGFVLLFSNDNIRICCFELTLKKSAEGIFSCILS